MSTIKHNKIKSLYQNWPNHTILTTRSLKSLDYSNSNIQKYLASGWIEAVGEGAYKKSGDHIKWEGAVYALLEQNKCHIGGKTALEEQGVAHYIKMHETDVYLFSEERKPLPKWFISNDFGPEIKYIKTTFLSSSIGITYKEYGDFRLALSSRERAILELIYLFPKYHTFEECNLVMQNMSTLRPRLVQELLERCDSVRVKRMFLFLATYNKHDFVDELNVANINLGSGYREIVKKGIFDPQFQINYPANLKEDDERKF